MTLKQGAEKIIKVCAACKNEENLVIVTDNMKQPIAEAFRQTALELGIRNTTTVLINAEEHGGQEPPSPAAKAMAVADVVLGITSKSISQTKARIEALKAGTRIVNLPDISEDDLTKGLIEADFAALSPDVKKVASFLEHGSDFVVTATGGTHLTFSGKGQPGNALDGLADKGGLFRSMSVEANIGPVDDTCEGTLVIDGSLPPVGVLNGPISCVLKNGRITAISGGKQADKFAELLRAYNDPQMYMVAEFGIGLNPCAKLTGLSYLADESAVGTVHFGFGTNLSQGGTRKAAAHFDAIIKCPTIVIDGKTIMKNGKFAIKLDCLS